MLGIGFDCGGGGECEGGGGRFSVDAIVLSSGFVR